MRYALESAPSWGADPKRVVLLGHSAGAQLVALLGTDPRILQRNGLASGAVARFIAVLSALLPFVEGARAH